jgi:hypothetical protein
MAGIFHRGPDAQSQRYFGRMRLQRGAGNLHDTGPPAFAKFLGEIAVSIGGLAAIMGLLVERERRMTPVMIRGAGGDCFPLRPLLEAPKC